MRTDPGLTPRERQVRAELARLACIEAGGHHYEHGREDCVVCGEPYPVIFEAGGHEFGLPFKAGDAVLYADGKKVGNVSHVEVYTNGDHLLGANTLAAATEAASKLGVTAREASDSMSRFRASFRRIAGLG